MTSATTTPRRKSTGKGSTARRLDAELLSEALVKAGRELGVTQGQLARLVDVSPATMSRIVSGSAVLEGRLNQEAALHFIRLYRSVSALTGSNPAYNSGWLHADNADLGGVPLELCFNLQGLVRVVRFLDAMRGPY